MSRSRDLLVLLGCGLGIGGCGAAVDDPNGNTASATGGEGRDELEQALEACGPWARHYVACYAEVYGSSSEYTVGYVSMMGYCISYFGYASIAGPGCADAMADYYACLAKIDCDVLTGDGDEDPDGDGEVADPCEPESNAREEACDIFVDSESDSEDIPGTDAGDADDGVFTVTDGESSGAGESSGGPPGGSTDGGSDSSTG